MYKCVHMLVSRYGLCPSDDVDGVSSSPTIEEDASDTAAELFRSASIFFHSPASRRLKTSETSESGSIHRTC